MKCLFPLLFAGDVQLSPDEFTEPLPGKSFTYVLNNTMYVNHNMKTLSSGFRTRSDTNQALQPQMKARHLKFRI